MSTDQATPRTSLQLVIADDHEAIRMIASQIAERALPDSTVRFAESVPRLLALLDQTRVDLVLLDLSMPGGVSRVQLVRAVRDRHDPPAVLIYSSEHASCLVDAAMDAGATGFVPKGAPLASLAAGLALVAAGQQYVHPSIARSGPHPWKSLTASERDVLRGLVGGATPKEIAANSGRGYTTVATLRANGMRKLGLRTNEELSPYFYSAGLQYELDPPHEAK